MTTMPLTEARNRLSELVDDVERAHERVVVTRHGGPASVLLSPGYLEALEETLDVLAGPGLLQQLQESRSTKETDDVLDSEELSVPMARRRRRT